MNEEQFRKLARERGYGDFQTKQYGPNSDGPLHTHEFSVILLVVDGQFALGFENSTTNYRPGEVCELGANIMHIERSGPTGAKVLLAKQRADAQPLDP